MFEKFDLLAASEEHPNRHPFRGLMTWFNRPSDRPVGGAKGKLVYISAEVGIPALESLHGMGINMKYDLAGHDPKYKVGVIERAWAGDPDENGHVPVYIEGYLYAQDFPEEFALIKEHVDALGFSYECNANCVDVFSDRATLKATAVTFTGASILFKNKAAYQNTQLAAQEEENMDEIKDQVEALAAALEAVKVDLAAAAEYKVLADKVEALESALTAAADKVTALECALAASEEKVTGLECALAEKLAAAADAPATVSVEDFEVVKGELETLKAEAGERAKHSRKSVAHPRTLMAQHGVEEADDHATLMASIEGRTDLTLEQRMALKFAARNKKNA